MIERYNDFIIECICFFFFQAEDGIRDIGVTGVQTCALPIYTAMIFVPPPFAAQSALEAAQAGVELVVIITEGIPAHDELKLYNTVKRDHPRSEERRVGKECRSRWSPYH